MSYELHLGDCLEAMRAMADNSVDSVVTDPPYGIRFMGKSWDGADIEERAAYRASMPSHAAACGATGGHRSVAAEAGAAAPVMGTEPTANVFSGAVSYSGMRERVPGAFHGDSGSAARFFYCAKTSRADRHEGLDNPGAQFKQGNTLRKVAVTDTKGNNHPTVKPTELMAYLLRLVTPHGGTALDPFMGSGSTGKAAMREGFNFIGCEQDPTYMVIARARIEYELIAENLRQQEHANAEQQLTLFSG